MTFWAELVAIVQNSPAWNGAITVGVGFLATIGILAILSIVTYALKSFFKNDPNVRKIHKVVIYFLTMAGVILLLFGALVGFVIPAVPGILLLLLALILLRRIYKNEWMERKIRYIQWKLRMKRKVKEVKEKVKDKVKEKVLHK